MEVIGSKLSRSLWRCYKSHFLSPRVLYSYSTSTTTTSSSSSSTYANDRPSSLYKRISLAGQPSISMGPILDQWISEGNDIQLAELHTIITRLKNFRRYTHALQVSAWMTEKHSSSVSIRDIATQLELISKLYGPDQAERFFNDIPESFRGPVINNALLNCYANAKLLKKAEDLMQKMKQLGNARVTVPYNIMLKMYYGLEMYDKAEQIIQEMEEKGLSWDTFTHRIQLTAYANSKKVKEMESVLMRMEADPQNTMMYADYIAAANGYLKSGVVDKSLVMLKRAEHLARGRVKKRVYHCLLTMYAHAKVKDEVYRIWELYKRSWDVYNNGRLCMVSALVILDDLDGAQKIVDEWAEQLSADQKVDSRIMNPLIRAYCKKGEMERAQALIDKLGERSNQELQRSTWEILSTGYRIHNQMENAVKTMKKAIVADGTEWKLTRVALMGCLEYLKMKGNPEELQEFKNLLEDHGYTANYLCSDHSEDTKRQPDSNDQVEEDNTVSLDLNIRRAS